MDGIIHSSIKTKSDGIRGRTMTEAINSITMNLSKSTYGAQLFLDWRGVVGVELANDSTPKCISADKSTLTLYVKRHAIITVQYKTNFILQRIHDVLRDENIQRILIKTRI